MKCPLKNCQREVEILAGGALATHLNRDGYECANSRRHNKVLKEDS